MITQGYVISPERISRLMKEMELICASSKKKIKYNFTPRTNFKNNILKRQFSVYNPNNVWVSEITVICVNYKPHYLCVIIDLFTRKVSLYSVLSSQKTLMVLETFKSAYENRKPIDLIFHSDQGSQYISWDFKSHLRSKRIKKSFSNPGCSYDNAIVESFFHALKTEEIYNNFYQTTDELLESISEYINFLTKKTSSKIKL